MIILFVFSYIFFIAIVCAKDWHKGLCFTLPFLAIMERRDMPRGVFGIDGINPFNIMLAMVLIAYILQKRKTNLSQIVLPKLKPLFIFYLLIFLIAFARLAIDYDSFRMFFVEKNILAPSMKEMIADNFVNRVKWLVPAVLLYLGTNTEARTRLALNCITITGLLFALQVISRMAPVLYGADDLAERALRVIDRNIGYHRTDLAGILGGAAWGSLVLREFYQSKSVKLFWVVTFITTTLALFLTGSRAAYMAWAICGLILIFLRWRRLIPILPPVFILMMLMLPGIQERMLQGFTEETQSRYSQKEDNVDTVDESGRDFYQITSGRVIIWPVVIDSIFEAPFFGHGMRAFQRLSLNKKILSTTGAGEGASVGHAHNAYLDFALDNGIIAILPVLAFYFLVINRARNKFSTKNLRNLETAKSGMVLSYSICTLLGYIGQGYLYPQQSAIFMYCAIAVFIGTWTKTNSSDQTTP